MIVGQVISNRTISEKGIMGGGDKCVCGERESGEDCSSVDLFIKNSQRTAE